MPFLQFKGKAAVETYHHTVPHHTLELDRKLSVLGNGEEPGLDGNLIIEGDNLLALKALLPTHAGRVKCIYIDPPYNTGEEGWVYNDNLTQPQFKEWIGQTVGKDEEDACRHDKWCCMMYPRLMLLKELLRDDGVILASIDDNEVHNLRMIMDEVFGAESFHTALVWKTRNTDNRLKSMLSTDHEYVLVYSMYGSALRGRTIDRSDFQNSDNDPHGPWVSDPLTGKATATERHNLHFTITNPETGDEYPPDPSRGWITDPAGIGELLADKRIWWPPNPQSGKPRKKRYLSETSERMPASSFWSDIKGQSGADEVDLILGKRLFNFPKSVEFMSRVLDLAAPPGSIVLDCTAGSGTTAHALLTQNARDKGNRTFVLVQQPFDSKKNEQEGLNICKSVTAERVRRVMKGYAFTGRQTEALLEEKVTLTVLKKADELLARMDAAKEANAGKFNDVTSECKEGVVRVLGVKDVKGKTEGLGGSFSYARLSAQPLFGEYRNLGETLPPYEEIAKYVFYTETSQQWSPKGLNKKTGFIGAHGGRSYYLLYRPNAKSDWALDMEFLREVAAKDDNREIVVYCEKIWAHRSDRSEWEAQTGKRLRAMLVPFNLK